MTNFNLPIRKDFELSPPVSALNVLQFIRQRIRRRPDVVALTDANGDCVLTYGQLDHQTGRCAAGLTAVGLRPGDTVLMLSPNSPDWVVIAMGAMAAGARVIGANPSCTVAVLTQLIRDSNARFVFTLPAMLDTVRPAAAIAGCEHLIVGAQAPGALSVADLLACTEPEPTVPQHPGAWAALLNSPEAHDLPEGAMLTERAVVSNLCQILHAASWAVDQVYLWPSSPYAKPWILR